MNKTSSISDLSVLNFVNSKEKEQLKAILLKEAFTVWEFIGQSVGNKDSFFEEIANQLFNGFLPHNWQELRTQLNEKALESEHSKIAFIWYDMDKMLDNGLADFVKLTDIFTWQSRELYENQIIFVSFLLGNGSNFPEINLTS